MSVPYNALHFEDRLAFPLSDIKAAVPVFPTRNEAVAAGKAFGWRSAIRLIDRFERGWVVGSRVLQSDEVAGIPHDVFRLPLLRCERREDGITYCPVLIVRRIQSAAQ